LPINCLNVSVNVKCSSTILGKKTISSYDIIERENINLHKQLNELVLQYNIAISDFIGKTNFYVTPENIGASSLLKPLGGYAGTKYDKIEVECTTINKFCEDYNIDKIDLMWIDLQGNELNAFKGANKYLDKITGICSEVGLIPYYENHTLYPEINKYLEGFNLKREENIPWTHNHGASDLEEDMMFFRRNK
jgi:FkbM family methyltransferase